MSAPRTLAPDVMVLESEEKVVELDELFRELHDSSAWKQLRAFLDGEWLRAVRLGLDEHETPAKVSWRCGYVDALAFLRDLPEEVQRRAKVVRGRHEHDEKVKKTEEAERRVPRHTVSG